MPIVLFFMLIYVDRDNITHVIGFFTFLFLYTALLISRVLYAKSNWHKEFGDQSFGKDNSIKKLDDLKNKIDRVNK